jgi:hypothetical protein
MSVAMSASGQYQLVGSNNAGATCYYSSDYGANWATSIGAPSSTQLWTLTMSASGQYACLAVYTAGLYYSSNYGQNWTASSGPTNTTIVSMSASGQYAIAGTAGVSSRYLYYSINNGQTWTISSYFTTGDWYGCAISASGQYALVVNAGVVNAVQSILPLLTGPINVTNTNIYPTLSLSLLASNIMQTIVPTTTSHGIIIGQAASTYNSFQILYNHVGAGNAANYMSIGTYNDASNVLNITATGNVGIGTISPVSQLHVYAGGAPTSITIGTSVNASCLQLGAAVINTNYSTHAVPGDAVIRVTDTGNLILQCGSGSSAIFIKNSNNHIGIGTSQPNALLTSFGNSNLGSSSTSVTTIAGTLNQTSGQSGGPFLYQSQWDAASTSQHIVTFISQLNSYTGGPYTSISLFNNMIGIITIYVRNTLLSGYSTTQYFVGHGNAQPTSASQISSTTYSTGAALFISYSFNGYSGNIEVNTNVGGTSPSIQVCWTITAAT